MFDFGNEKNEEAEKLKQKLKANNCDNSDLESLKPKISSDSPFKISLNFIKALIGKSGVLNLTDKPSFGSNYVYKDIEWGIPLKCNENIARSLAKSGLSNVWGATCYPLTKDDYLKWPISMKDMDTHYRSVSKLLSITEANDCLNTFYPKYRDENRLVTLNKNSEIIYKKWVKNKDLLVTEFIWGGRTRLAVKTKEEQGSNKCVYCEIGRAHV